MSTATTPQPTLEDAMQRLAETIKEFDTHANKVNNWYLGLILILINNHSILLLINKEPTNEPSIKKEIIEEEESKENMDEGSIVLEMHEI